MIKQNRNCIELSEKKTKICENLVNETKQEVCKAAKKRMTTIQGNIDGEPKEKQHTGDQKRKQTIIDNLVIRSDQKRVFCSFNSSLKSG